MASSKYPAHVNSNQDSFQKSLCEIPHIGYMTIVLCYVKQQIPFMVFTTEHHSTKYQTGYFSTYVASNKSHKDTGTHI